MESVKDHYDSFLGEVYSWILGDFDAAYQKNVALFASMDLVARPGSIAVDLGCGPGCQALPLAELGFEVIAVDFCQVLLDELQERSAGHPVTTVCDDILNFSRHVQQPPDLIVCMGDTLVHLPDRASVAALLDQVSEALQSGGTFIYAIRDYVSFVPTGPERFVPVRADAEQIFTCFLDYKDDVVHVHDVLHRRSADGWRMTISDYLKQRLDSEDLDRQLVACGFEIVRREVVDGMITVVATRR